MKKNIALIAALFVCSLAHADDQLVQTCIGVPSEPTEQICTSQGAGTPVIYAISLTAGATTISVSSEQSYNGVDASQLTLGLKSAVENGLNPGLTAHLIGPSMDSVKAIPVEMTAARATLQLAQLMARQAPAPATAQ